MHPAVAIVMTVAARRAALPQPFARHSFALDDSNLFFGTYCDCASSHILSVQDVERLSLAASDIVKEKIPILVKPVPFADCLGSFLAHGQTASASLVKSTSRATFKCWHVGDVFGLLPAESSPKLLCSPQEVAAWESLTAKAMDTSDASGIEMIPYNNGFLLRTSSLPAPRLNEFKSVALAASKGTTSLGELSERAGKHPKRFVLEGEAAFDRNVLDCVHCISQRDCKALRLILIAGPSASGKTTFAAKLSLALRSCGFEPVVLSTDDYYKDVRDADYPRTPEGNLNHEIVTALRLDDLQRDMKALFQGNEVNTPIFDMVLSRPKEHDGRKLRMKATSILIMEGIFALDPLVTSSFAPEEVFKVFIVPLPRVQLDEHHTLGNQVVRLLRRISRDYLHRGRDAAASIKRVPIVQMGENNSIFKTIQYADFVMNSFVEHELSVLAVPLVPLLRAVQPQVWQYQCARSLLTLAADLACPVSDAHLPAESLIREFVGGSAFEIEAREVHTPTEFPVTPLTMKVFSADELFEQAQAATQGSTYQQLLAQHEDAVLALVDDCEVCSLQMPTRQAVAVHNVRPLPLASPEGAAAIMNTGIFLLHAAVKSLWSGRRQVVVQHGFADEASKTCACVCVHITDISGSSAPTSTNVTEDDRSKIEALMRQWIAEKKAVDVASITTRQAASLFRREKMRMTAALIETTRTPSVHVARLDQAYCLVVEPLLLHCGDVDFVLGLFDGGLEIDFPVFIPESAQQQQASRDAHRQTGSSGGSFVINKPVAQTPATLALYQHRELALAAHQSISCVGDVNSAIFRGKAMEMIQVSEALLAKQLVDLVRRIEHDRVRIVFLAGSSSSGKSVVCEQLRDQLHTNARMKGKPEVDSSVTTIVLDNFYKNVTDPAYPKTANGDKLDYESVSALRLDYLSETLQKLLVQRIPVDVNIFDLGSGMSTNATVRLSPPEESDGVVLVEGIFALQAPVVELFKSVLGSGSSSAILQVMVQPMPLVSLDELHYIPAQQLRIVRRIVRDYIYRQRDAQETLSMWENVAEGEERNWLPFVGNADVIFNAHCIYEIGALKGSCQTLLQHVDPRFEQEYADAQRLLSLLRWIHVVPAARIPKQSIVQQLMEEAEVDESEYNH